MQTHKMAVKWHLHASVGMSEGIIMEYNICKYRSGLQSVLPIKHVNVRALHILAWVCTRRSSSCSNGLDFPNPLCVKLQLKERGVSASVPTLSNFLFANASCVSCNVFLSMQHTTKATPEAHLAKLLVRHIKLLWTSSPCSKVVWDELLDERQQKRHFSTLNDDIILEVNGVHPSLHSQVCRSSSEVRSGAL